MRPAQDRTGVSLQVLVGCTLLVAFAASVPAVGSAPPPDASVGSAAQTHDWSSCVGTVSDPAEGLTVVALQGYVNKENYETVGIAKLVALGPRGDVRWVHDSQGREFWFYDVDPTARGTLFVTASIPNGTSRLFELDPATGERVWEQVVPFEDTHDADLVDDGSKILLANMRNNIDNSSHDQVVVIDRNGTVEWAWKFRNHYPDSVADGVTSDDWTHLNDVEEIGDGFYLASPRNFDQVVAIDRASGEIRWRLGRDGDLDTLYEQHNPDYLESEDGTPTVLVSDSANDRAVEYARRDGGWEQTWAATDLEWPRDADRLPNGNTLVAVSGEHRVVEVTPQGEVVWEVTLPGSPYDVERIEFGDESSGPTMADAGVTGDNPVHGAGGAPSIRKLKDCQSILKNASRLSGSGASGGNGNGGAGDGGGSSDGSDRADSDSGNSDRNSGDGDATGGSGATPLAAVLATGALLAALAAVAVRLGR